MLEEDIEKAIERAEMNHEKLKDMVHDQYDEIERLKSNINKAIEYMNEVLECNYHGGNVTFDVLVHNTVNILKENDDNDKRIGN